ncbi:MAG: hypothetical protein U1C33_07540, partial [Candidatus Cloacimonadaceae bacterium]|nr:hypothetical protein [Candidatus Cloacimonadaceae bacterium]
MKRYIIAICLILCSIYGLFAGRYAGDFMLIGAGVRALGMGGAFAAVADDGSTIYWNASGIGQITKSEVSVMHAFLYNGLASYDNISFCQPLPNQVTIGFNVTRLSIDDIPYFDEKYLIGTNVDQRINNMNLQLTGIPDGRFRSVDDLYQFAFAKHIRYDANLGWLFFEVPFDFFFGGNIKYIKRQIKDNYGTGTGDDFGILVKTDLSTIVDIEYLGELALGLNFQDVSGTDISWDTATESKDEILYNTKLGVSIKQPIESLHSSVTLAYDRDYVYGGTNHFGIEWNYKE